MLRNPGGAWRALSGEHMTLDLRVVSSNPMLGVEINYKINLFKKNGFRPKDTGLQLKGGRIQTRQKGTTKPRREKLEWHSEDWST